MRSVAALLGLATLLGTPRARAADYYVSATADGSGAGTLDRPFRTVEQGQAAASPGDTVFIRGGLYAFSGTTTSVGVAFTKSGEQGRPIRYFAYPGERPLFELSGLTPQARVTGLDVACSFIHLRGLEVSGVQQVIVGDSWSVRIRGDGNVVENLDVHHGEAPGIFITSGAGNLILNCDSHHNHDPLEGGGNADGFGCHSSGGGNVISGCRGYSNSDDGFDFINAPGTCTVEGSWAFGNGYVPGTTTPAGNGAGFKSGGFGSPPKIPGTGVPRHVIRFNVAFGNRSQGFYANHHPGGLDFLNNTAFRNSTNFDMLVEGGASTHTLRNNLAVSPGTAVARFTGGSDGFNSWTLPVTVSADDFLSITESEALAPRQADGSLPNVAFLHLAAGSDLVDRGEDIGFPYGGAAPDLGAFEAGLPLGSGGAASGEGGAGGRGLAGAAGAGGASGEGGASSATAGGTPNAGGGVPAGAAGAFGSGGGTGLGGTSGGGGPGGFVTGGTAAWPSSGGVFGAGGTGAPAARSSATGDDGGCSCRAARRSEGTSWALLVALLGIFARRRVALRARA